MAKKEVLDGNVAVAEAAIRAGCRFFSGYPITPQTTFTEYLSYRMPEVGGEFIQAESEVSAVYMLQGAAAVGGRALTATSGQGFALMTEGMSVINAQDLPSVIVDIERGGPGGCPILPSQSDYYFAVKSVGHGGFRAYVLGPSTLQEAVDLMYEAFDFAEKYRCLVLMLTDGMQGLMMEAVEMPPFKEVNMDKPWAASGNRGRETRSVGFIFTLDEEQWTKPHDAMYKVWEKNEVKVEEYLLDDAETVVLAWGSAARTAKTPIKKLRAEGKKVGMIRPITLYPFPFETIRKLDPAQVKNVLVLENSLPAQFYHDVDHALCGKIPLHLYTRSAGNIITPEEAETELRKLI
jgi:2-oxoglutarate ferredoxin oxidoreductase subunit alpha